MNPPPPGEGTRERKGELIQRTGFDYRELALRVSLVALNFGAIAFFWWSLQTVLLPLQNQASDANLAVTRLISEVDRMERVLAEGDGAQVRSKFSDIRSWMFVGRSAVDAWLAGLKEEVLPLALDVEFDFSRSDTVQPSTATNTPILINPARVSLRIQPATGIEALASTFQRTLQLSQQLAGLEKRVDLVELTAVGGSNSVATTVVVMDLWTGEESDLQ
jgi:hypothetical protein